MAVGTLQAQALREKAFFATLFNASGRIIEQIKVPRGKAIQITKRLTEKALLGEIRSYYFGEAPVRHAEHEGD